MERLPVTSPGHLVGSLGHYFMLLAVLASAGCGHHGSIVGTWVRDPETTLESGEPDPRGRRFITYSADGTFHLELYGADSPDPRNQIKGTYKLIGDHLSTITPDLGHLAGQPVPKEETVTISQNTMTVSDDEVPWHRVNFPYNFVDHSLDVVGRWKGKGGVTLQLNSDGTFTVEGPLAAEMLGGKINPGGSVSGGGAFGTPLGGTRGTGGMVAGRIFAADGTQIAGKGIASKHLGTVRGSGRGRYTCEGKLLSLNGSFTPSAGKDKGVVLGMGPIMILNQAPGRPERLQMLAGTRYANAGSLVRVLPTREGM